MRIVSALPFLAVATLGCAQSSAPVFTPEAVRAHVTFLADDLLEGRKTGSRGYDIAARYVATRFAAYGLKPGGEDGWFQTVTFQRTEFVRGSASLAIIGPAGTQRFANGTDAVVYLNPQQLQLALTAPLVFAGFGIQNELLRLDDYVGLDVRGKIVVVLSGFPKGLPSEEGAHLNSTKRDVAERLGAVGMITVPTRERQQIRPWARVQEGAWEADFRWVAPDGQVHVGAPGIRAGAMVHTPAAEAVFAGAPRTLESVLEEADRKDGRPRGFPLTTRAAIEYRSTAQRVASANVIGLLPGSDPTLAAQHVVLSAHLDHIGVNEPDPRAPDADRINNGALDNAAGIATMLEVARAAAAAPARPRRSILFLASTGEEAGLLGADYFARHPTVPIGQIVANVDLDMPVLLYPFTDVIAFGANHSGMGPLVARAAGAMGIGLAPDPSPEEGVFTRSDHYMFVKQGVPAVFLATGHANGGEKAWREFLAGPYHHPNDDLKQPIDWQAGARFAEVNYRITREMADADAPPLWNDKDFFGDTFAPGRPRRKQQ
jgi:Zn-dependent M28 family amino/carboxypeptidase